MKKHTVSYDEIAGYLANREILLASHGKHKQLSATGIGIDLSFIVFERGRTISAHKSLIEAVDKYNSL